MQTLELFPTIVGIFDYPNFIQYAPAWRAEIGKSLKERQEILSFSHQPQRQTDDRLHERPTLAPLIEFFLQSCYEYMSYLKYRQGTILRLQCCWATVAFQDDRIEMHQHPNSFITGAFYLDVDEEAEPILFTDPRPQNRVLDIGVDENLRINRKYHTINPKNGRLIIFPSWLEHKVGPNRSEVPRVSIAFNMTVHGDVGGSERLSRAIL